MQGCWMMQNRTLQSVGGSELACPPSVTPVVMQLQPEQGRNISLKCKVTGIPEAVITWAHDERILSNGSLLLNPWDTDFFQVSEYYSDSNTKVSELHIISIRVEDSGNYFCSGQNAAGSARANFTIRVFKRKEEAAKKENITQESKQMFKVEYILGFGAAVVIVLTIIIVLILYLILQCKQKRRERQLRKLICDSRSSDSFAERSTVDYIVPGEMELMSAVRSVSCNSSMSKCNKTEDEDEYGPNSEGPPLIDSMFVKPGAGPGGAAGAGSGDCPPPPPPPNGNLSCSNPDLVQDTKMWDRSQQQAQARLEQYRASTYAPHQYFPPRMMFNYNPRLGYMPGPAGYQPGMPPGYLGPAPPQYRPPPPVQIHSSATPHRDIEDDNINETVLSAANLNGSPMPGHFYGGPEMMVWSQPPTSLTQHTAQFNNNQQLAYANNPYLGLGYRQQPFEHTKDCPRSRTMGGFHSSNSRMGGQQLRPGDQSMYNFQQRQFPPAGAGQPLMMGGPLSRPGQLQYPPGQDYHNQFGGYGPPPYNPPPVPQWSAEEEEMKYGPFSDGEAESMRRGTRSCKKSRSRAAAAPHYATMSRVHDFSCKQSSLESNEGSTIKYTSQPQLNGNINDYPVSNLRQYHGPTSEALTPLSLKTSITFPRQPVQGAKMPERQRKPSCPSLQRQDNVRSYDSSSGQYPDLARHPLSYSVAPPLPPHNRQYRHSSGHHPSGYTPHVTFPSTMNRSYNVNSNRQNSSDDGHFDYEHSRSSSLGDINWPGLGYNNGNGVGPEARMATPDGFKSLPYDSNIKLAVNGVKRRTPRSGAVKIDLTCADKSIRRPGSAPDLVSAEEVASCHNSPGANSLKKNGSLKDNRARSTSSESRGNGGGDCVNKKVSVGPSPSTRKVAFAGIEDDESESESEKQSVSVTSVEEEVWVKQPPAALKPAPTLTPAIAIAVKPAVGQPGAVVVGGPQRASGPPPPPPQRANGPPPPPPQRAPPPPPPHRESFPTSSKPQQQTNKCNGIR